jgi:hypothetical protein
MKLVRLTKMCLNETYSKVHIGKYLSDIFSIQNYLKQDALSSLLFNFALAYDSKVQETQVGLKINGIHQLLVYADDVNLLGDNISTVKKNIEILIISSREIDLKVNAKKTLKYTLLSYHQNAGQNHSIKEGRSFENMAQLKYFGRTITNQNLIQEEIKRRLNSSHACYHSAQNMLASHLLSKNVKIRIYKTILLPVLLYGCETWSQTVREEQRPWVFENGMLSRICGLQRDQVTGGWRNLHNEGLVLIT